MDAEDRGGRRKMSTVGLHSEDSGGRKMSTYGGRKMSAVGQRRMSTVGARRMSIQDGARRMSTQVARKMSVRRASLARRESYFEPHIPQLDEMFMAESRRGSLAVATINFSNGNINGAID
jgi:hypothetical protein